ncbi:acetylglutamate kinase [compost metagenome]
MTDVNDDNSVINTLDRKNYEHLKSAGKIFAGMIPKLDNAFAAIEAGVSKVIIGQAEELTLLISAKSGTTIQ